MNSPSVKHLNLHSIYPGLVIGFVALLFLIWLTGNRSASKINEISVSAGESTDAYMERLTRALSIGEAVTEVVAEARVYRARQVMKVPIPPFRPKLKAAKNRFQAEIEKGAKLWSKREEPDTRSKAELAAWRDVEAATAKFLNNLTRMEDLPNLEDSPNSLEPDQPGDRSQGSARGASQHQSPQAQPAQPEQSEQSEQSETEQNTHKELQSFQNDFLKSRVDLDSAARKLTEAVAQTQQENLQKVADRQKQAASEVRRTAWAASALGVIVAATILGFVWKQILQLRQASRLEQEARDFARSVFDSQSNDILVVNNDGELLEVNKAFLSHFSLPAPSLVLQEYRAALAHLPEVAAFVGKALDQPDDSSSLRERIEVRLQNGYNDQNLADLRLFDVYASPLTRGGQPGGRVVVIVDVTEAEKVREELRRSRTLSAVGQIAATVAHELYNPIGAVKLNLDLLEMQANGDGDMKHTVERLKRGVDHLSTIVMDLRYLTRTRDPERRTTDLNKLLDEVVELASDRLQRSRISIERNYAPQAPSGEYDPQQLRKVFLNLLINAVEASPQNSGVELKTRYVPGAHGELVISVIDRGVGMSNETKRRLFEAFYTTKRNGTGLGMMITQEIVKKHGGRMEVESREGMGTTVSVYLPV